MTWLDKSLQVIVTENYVYASVLHHFGIKFYLYSEKTLAQICQVKGLNSKQLTQSLEAEQNSLNPPEDLAEYPIDLIIKYLQHNHAFFVKEKLPYVAKLVEDLTVEKIGNKSLVRDLQLLFPLFIDDFIHHIHQEEDTFFRYILLLQQAQTGKTNLTKLYFEMEQYSIQYFALDHHTHDDEMRGIREITNNYELNPQATLHLKVIFEELKALERDLQTHARIEDEILFIKAMQLEKQLKEKLGEKVKWN